MPDPAWTATLGLAAHCGQALIVLSVLAVVASLLRIWPRARRVRRRARLMAVRARTDQEVLGDGVILLLAQGLEIQRLLQPWRRIWFWWRHPLTSALRSQYFRR